MTDTTTREPIGDYVWDSAAEVVDWLDRHSGDDDLQQTLRLLKIGEEYGEAISAWIGLQGQNPRKGVNADLADVQGELCDVILAAAVALLSITRDTTTAVNLLAGRADDVLDRITD
ncbi:MazG-like family protein [Actinocorallia populi]|uniref:MazG-like family protein n=1 Tax=Actinocorallia populi TaxID=2079200 RepID=UPI000D0920E9|nr:MazG-like family protein [Actinocorallia populi]